MYVYINDFFDFDYNNCCYNIRIFVFIFVSYTFFDGSYCFDWAILLR